MNLLSFIYYHTAFALEIQLVKYSNSIYHRLIKTWFIFIAIAIPRQENTMAKFDVPTAYNCINNIRNR